MTPAEEESLKNTRRWSRFSVCSNLATLLLAVVEYCSGYAWIVLAVDVLVLAGLAFFFKAFYECVRARTREALVKFLPALVVQLVILAMVGVAVWLLLGKTVATPS